MPANALLDTPHASQTSIDTLEEVILRHLEEQAVIGLEALIIILPDFSWNQIFHAVDRLARYDRITLRRHCSEYTLFSTHYAA